MFWRPIASDQATRVLDRYQPENIFEVDPALKRDEIGLNRHRALALCLSMIFSENRCTLFRIMLLPVDCRAAAVLQAAQKKWLSIG